MILLVYVVSALLIIAADQLSKLYISLNFVEGESIRLLPYFYITYVRNFGAAFGLFANFRWLFLVLGFITIALVIYFRSYLAKQNQIIKWGVTIAVAGTIGNMIDRIHSGGAVIDFIDTTVFPIFNIADMAIVIGVAFLFLEVLIFERRAPNR